MKLSLPKLIHDCMTDSESADSPCSASLEQDCMPMFIHAPGLSLLLAVEPIYPIDALVCSLN